LVILRGGALAQPGAGRRSCRSRCCETPSFAAALVKPESPEIKVEITIDYG
jgi:hypothetical protein